MVLFFFVYLLWYSSRLIDNYFYRWDRIWKKNSTFFFLIYLIIIIFPLTHFNFIFFFFFFFFSWTFHDSHSVLSKSNCSLRGRIKKFLQTHSCSSLFDHFFFRSRRVALAMIHTNWTFSIWSNTCVDPYLAPSCEFSFLFFYLLLYLYIFFSYSVPQFFFMYSSCFFFVFSSFLLIEPLLNSSAFLA